MRAVPIARLALLVASALLALSLLVPWRWPLDDNSAGWFDDSPQVPDGLEVGLWVLAAALVAVALTRRGTAVALAACVGAAIAVAIVGYEPQPFDAMHGFDADAGPSLALAALGLAALACIATLRGVQRRGTVDVATALAAVALAGSLYLGWADIGAGSMSGWRALHAFDVYLPLLAALAILPGVPLAVPLLALGVALHETIALRDADYGAFVAVGAAAALVVAAARQARGALDTNLLVLGCGAVLLSLYLPWATEALPLTDEEGDGVLMYLGDPTTEVSGWKALPDVDFGFEGPWIALVGVALAGTGLGLRRRPLGRSARAG